MARVQVNDNFGGERLQTAAQPNALAAHVERAPEDTRWRALANVFAQGTMLSEMEAKRKEAEDREAATAWAQSMTVGELGKAIKEGKMLPSQSPAFVGTAQHIWGVNTHEAGLRDIQSKLTTGELKFNSAQEADQYLTEWRNTALAGQSRFAIAGFDKTYSQTRDKIMDGVTRQNDKELVDAAQGQAVDFLANSLNEVTGKDFTGTPKDAAEVLMGRYQLLRHTMTLPDGARKGALQEMLTRLAGGGQTSVLNAMLDSKMEGLGSLRGYIGETKAQTLINHANSTFDGAQRQRIDDESLPWYQQADKGELNVDKFRAWGTSEGNKKYVTSAFINAIENANQAAQAKLQRELHASQLEGAIAESENAAQQGVLAAFREGRLWEVKGTNNPMVLGKNGEPKKFDVDTFINKAGTALVAKLPFDQQVSAFALNGQDNPDWKEQMTAGYTNLASIRLDAKGKPVGELNEAGKKSIELYRQLDQTNPEYTKRLLGDKVYERYSNISFLQHFGKGAAEAASLVANADAQVVVGSDMDKLDKSIKTAANKLVDEPWYHVGWIQRLRGENTSANTAAVTGTVRRYASLLAKSGMYGDTESALEAVSQYIADPKVSARVNGTLYMRSEMPTGPASKSQEEWMGRFMDEVVKPHAKTLNASGDQVRLEYDQATQSYRAFAGAFPLASPDTGEGWVVSKQEMERWYGTAEAADVKKAVAEGQSLQLDKAHQKYRDRLWKEVGQVQKDEGRFAMERYDGTPNQAVLEKRIFGREAFERITKDGNAGKSLGELMKLYPRNGSASK